MKEHTHTYDPRPAYHDWLGLAPDSENIPDALKAMDQWVLWRAEPRADGRRSKVPYSPWTGGKASSTDPRTWSDSGTAWAAYEEAPEIYAGVGFVLTDSDQLVGIDLDHCVDAATGNPASEAADIVARCETYAEISPSGTGLRIVGYGEKITAACPQRGLEIYSRARFVTITGRRLRGGELGTIPGRLLRELVAAARAAQPEAGQRDRATPATLTSAQIGELRSALASMRSDDRELWVGMGMALRELGDVGRGLWIEWSQSSRKYDPAEATRVWDSLKPERTGYAAVFATARRAGWVNPRRAQARAAPPALPAGTLGPDAGRVSKHGDAPQASGGDWPQPKPITAELRPLPAFDAEVLLPEPLREWVADEADRMPCPPDYVAAAAIVALGSVIGARCAIRPKSEDDWEVVPNLWGGIVGLPSAKKTPALNAALKPLARLAKRAREEHKKATAELEISETILDANRGALEKRVKDAARAGK